jgi:pilus assembly protein FimV
MSHRKTALALMVALALPGAAQALGLGEIHLNSALNEPLAADIDIVGATPDDLAGITASIANQETFQHFGVDRPEFLSTVALKISRDSRGRAVLAVRSTDACTELLLNMLVDLRWRGGELIRQYTLLLDPPGFPSATPVAAALVAGPATYKAPVSVRPAASKAPIEMAKPVLHSARAAEQTSPAVGDPAARKTIKVGAKATLRGVAWRVGSRSDADINRMMIAIFHANPNAFEGNINRLRRGAVLTIPSAAEVSAITAANAGNEVHAQMLTWHASSPPASLTKSVTPAVARSVASHRESAVPNSPTAGNADAAITAPAPTASARGTTAVADAPAETALDGRVQQLEKGLGDLRNQLDREHDALVRAQNQLTLAEKGPAQVVLPQTSSGRGIVSSVAAILALAAAAFGMYIWRRRRGSKPRISPAAHEMQKLAPVVEVAQAASGEAADRIAPVRGEARAVQVGPHDVSHKTHDAQSGGPLHAEAGDRRSSDAVARHLDGAATGPKEEVNPYDGIDTETLEASYLLEASGVGLDDSANFGDAATVKLSVVDPNAETIPVEVARIVELPDSTAPALPSLEHSMPAPKAGAETTKLDYNLLDLDATVHHVQMPSALHENVGFKERRTSLVDALKGAVQREPHRWDLRMKLLETYYAAAATNRQGFLDIVQNIGDDRAKLNASEWEKIAWMGRQIAADDALFAPAAAQPDEEDLANCA